MHRQERWIDIYLQGESAYEQELLATVKADSIRGGLEKYLAANPHWRDPIVRGNTASVRHEALLNRRIFATEHYNQGGV